MEGEARPHVDMPHPSPSPEPSPLELEYVGVQIGSHEVLLDIARCVLNDIPVEQTHIKALRDWLKDRVLENKEIARLWQKKLEGDPDADIYLWIADSPQPAKEFLRQYVNVLEQAGVKFVLTPSRGDLSYAYQYSLNGRLLSGADVKLIRAAAEIIGVKGHGFSLEAARRLLVETGKVVREEDLDPPGLLFQADGTVLDPRQLRVYERVDWYFSNSLGASVTAKDIDVIKSLINVGYTWEEAEDIVLQNYAPTFARVIDNVFRTGRERAQLREVVGSIFYPGVLRVAFVIVGAAGIGKSVIADALLHVLGDYAASKPWSSLLGEDGEKHAGGLRGKYANIVSESPKYMIKHVELFKRLTGDEWLEGRVLYRNFFKFRNMCKHIVLCNKVPVFTEIDEAVAGRMYIIEASGEPPETPDPQLRDKVRREAKGILLWMLLNHVYFSNEGFTFKHKPDIEHVEKLMITARSNVYTFVEDLFGGGAGGYIAEVVRGAKTRGKQVREAYVNWCMERGEEVVGAVKFYEDFASATLEKGVIRTHDRGSVIFMNMRLIPIKAAEESHLLAN
ncbi:MAG: DUF5906 domain-containing protein [Thermofilaceae archaeon]